MSITTLTYDPGTCAVVAGPSARSVTITLAYDISTTNVRCLDVEGVIATCTYVDAHYSGGDELSKVVHSTDGAGAAQGRLITKLLMLFRDPPRVERPLWWHVWRTVAEDPWLRLQQLAIARRMVRQQQCIDEMCQFSTIHLGRVFELWPSLGLALDELPSQFPRRARRVIRRDFFTWLRLRSNERRHLVPWPAQEFVDFRNVELIEELDIAAAMADLPPLYRDVVEMRSFGYRRSEIARAMNLSIRQIDRIFSSCREHLRRRLRSLGPG